VYQTSPHIKGTDNVMYSLQNAVYHSQLRSGTVWDLHCEWLISNTVSPKQPLPF